MPSVIVVFILPIAEDHPGLGNRPEQVEVQASSRARPLSDVPVAPRFAEWNEGRANAFTGPVDHRGASEFWSVVAAQHGWVSAAGGEDVELVDDGTGGDSAFDEFAEAIPGVFVDDRHDLEWAAGGGGIELEVQEHGHESPISGVSASWGNASAISARRCLRWARSSY